MSKARFDVRWRPWGDVIDGGSAACLVVVPATQTRGAMFRAAGALCDANLLNDDLRLELHEPPDSKVGFAIVLDTSLVCSVDEAVEEWPTLRGRVLAALEHLVEEGR